MQLGFIGFGEAAFELSAGLNGEGVQQICAYDVFADHPTYGTLIRERAAKVDVDLRTSPQEVANQANIIIVAVPADKTYEVSETVKPFLKEGSIYIDVSASPPDVKRRVSENLKDKGILFGDAAMMGPLPVYKHKVPILVSGSGADRFVEVMTPYGMDISKVSDNPGDASAVKLIRSIYMKGVAALFIELLEAAHEFQVEDLVVSSISETMSGRTFEETMNRLVTGTSIHALRRSLELEGSIDMLESSQLNAVMSKAARDKLQLLSQYQLKDKFKGQTPAHWLEVITAMKKSVQEINE